MEKCQHFQETVGPLMPLIIILIIWEAAWKLVGMWKAARNNQLGWFICIALINTVGILPIIYILKQKREGER